MAAGGGEGKTKMEHTSLENIFCASDCRRWEFLWEKASSFVRATRKPYLRKATMKIHRLVNLHLPGYRSTIKVKEEFTVALCSAVLFGSAFLSFSFMPPSFVSFLGPCLCFYPPPPTLPLLASFCRGRIYGRSFTLVKWDLDLYQVEGSLALRGHLLFWNKLLVFGSGFAKMTVE